ncbi:ABC transporter ATP-binding protein [Bacillus salitolerans]|uniref:ABC transporter ATP-binding protein n=1 Tax=Bacillus salitolerans TaxID=1437434 RepID=A0ABW4LQV7_9BACI
MNYLIETNKLTKQYGKERVVDAVHVKIQKGQIYGFLGPNGAGKTTTIRMMLGLITPTEGEILYFGKPFRKNKIDILQKVGSLVESPSYYGHLNATENLEVYRKILGVNKSRIEEVLTIVGLSHATKKKVKEYSLGMKQRLGIATALLGHPEILILDEPTNGLDPAGIQEIRNLIKRLAHEQGLTIIVSSHLLSEVDQMATHVGIISKGQLIFQDCIEELRRRSTSSICIKVEQTRSAWNLLLAKGLDCTLEDDSITLRNIDDSTVATIVESLVKNNISIYRVKDHKTSLEEIFLKIIEEDSANVARTISR